MSYTESALNARADAGGEQENRAFESINIAFIASLRTFSSSGCYNTHCYSARAANRLEALQEEHMKSNKSAILAVVLIISIVSVACSPFTGGGDVTQKPTETIFKPVTELLVIDPAALPDAQVGVMYKAEIHITHNVTPVSDMRITAGALPAGLELVFQVRQDSAIITGIPSKTGTFSLTLLVVCYSTMVIGQTLKKDYQIVVKE